MTSKEKSDEIKDLADQKGREEAKEFFIEEIAIRKERIKNYHATMNEYGSTRRNASIKGLFHLASVVEENHVDTIEWVRGLLDVILAMYDDYSTRVTKLEKAVEAIEKAGLDISNVKATVEELKTAVDSPKIDAIAKFLDSMKNVNERKKLASDQYVE